MVRILFVCLGNICRSPTAHGLFRGLVQERGLAARIQVDSCGTSGYHVGEGADGNMQRAARDFGYDLSDQVSRQLHRSDYSDFDLLIAMDRANEREIRRRMPQGSEAEIVRFMSFVPNAPGQDVPDPYYGGLDGFREVVRLIERGCGPLLEHALALDEER
jgi:protein-tyrosine phosphatase